MSEKKKKRPFPKGVLTDVTPEQWRRAHEKAEASIQADGKRIKELIERSKSKPRVADDQKASGSPAPPSKHE